MSTPRDSDKTETRLHSEYRPDQTPVEAIVTAVADVTGQSPLAMDPLGEVVDTDSLNTLVNSRGDGPSSVTITFDYCGQHVIVTTNSVRIAPSNSLQ